MELILFRHGIAHDQSPDGSDDARALTDEGHKKTRQAAQGLVSIIGKPSLILTSPKVRAVETAAHLVEAAAGPEAQVHEVLAGSSAKRITEFLLTHDQAVVVAVGHEPTLSMAAELLCTGDQRLGLIELKKAGAIGISLPAFNRQAAVPGRLQWILPPSVLRGLAQ